MVTAAAHARAAPPARSAAVRRAGVAAPRPMSAPPVISAAPQRLQRRCACGGSCPSCIDPESIAQPRLEIGAVDDPLEREADRVASAVMERPATSSPALPSAASLPASARAPASAPATAPVRATAPALAPASASAPARRVARGKGDDDAGRLPDAATLTTGGEPLAAPLRAFFEPRLGRDLAHVRVHTDAAAQTHNRSLRAEAFTVGSHVWLGHGARPAPNWLMAHELTHVLQQTGAGAQAKPHLQPGLQPWVQPWIQRAPAGCPDDPSTPPPPRPSAFADDATLVGVRTSIFERRHQRLRRGDTGEAVALVQELLLNELCTGIDRNALSDEWADLRYGAATVRAVKRYQQTHLDALGRPLDADGSVGPLTLGALDATVGLPVLPPARDPEGEGDCFGIAEQGPGEAELLLPSKVPDFGDFKPSDAVWMLSNFDVAKHFIKTEHRAFLRDNVVPRINALPKSGDSQVRVIGEASTTASDAFNLALSERRAACARAALLDAGLDDAARIGKVVGYGEGLARLTRIINKQTPTDNAEDRHARRVSIVLQSGKQEECSDADRTRASSDFIVGVACDSRVTFRIHIGDVSDPARPTWREFLWWHLPWPPDCALMPSAAVPLPGMPLPLPVLVRMAPPALPLHLARRRPDDPTSASDFDGLAHIVSNFSAGGLNFLINDLGRYSAPVAGLWTSTDCADKASGTPGWLRPVGPVHCGEMPPPVARCKPVVTEEHDDCPDAYRETAAQKYNAVLFGGSADISKVLPPWLQPFIPLGVSGAVLGLATTNLPGRQLMRFFVHAGISVHGGGSGLDRLEVAAAPEKDVGEMAQLQQSGTGPSSWPFARSDFSLNLNALLTLAGASNRIDVETGVSDFSFFSPHCNHGGERVYHGVLRPAGPAFCLDGPLPEIPVPEMHCDEPEECPDSALLASHRHIRVRVGRATTMSLPPGMRDRALRFGCQLVAAELNVDTDDADGGPIQRPLALLLHANDCGFNVARADVPVDFTFGRRLAIGDPRNFTAASDFTGVARLDAAGDLIIAGSYRPLRLKLPGAYDASCTGARGALGAVLPLDRVDCGLAPEPDHDTRPERDHAKECEAFKAATAPLVDDAVAQLASGAFAPLIDPLGAAPRVLVPPLVYEEWLRTRRPGDVITNAPFVGKAPGLMGDVPVVGFTTLRILSINTDKTMNVEFLTDFCAFDAKGRVIALKPRGCNDDFIRAGDVRRIHTFDFGALRRRTPDPDPDPDSGTGSGVFTA